MNQDDMNYMVNGDFEKLNSSDDFKNERMYTQDLYYLKQAFLSDNRSNIKKFVANYFFYDPFKIPKRLEANLNHFYFDNEAPVSNPYEERYVKSNDYCFKGMIPYISILNDLKFFDENINIDQILGQCQQFILNSNCQLFNLNPFMDSSNKVNPFMDSFNNAKFFTNGIINKNATVSLYNNNVCVGNPINLSDFLVRYLKKEIFSIPKQQELSIDPMLFEFPKSYWDYLNQSIYQNERKFTMCASVFFPIPLKHDLDSNKKRVYLNSAVANLYCFKAIYNSILSEKFRYKVAEEYMKSDEVVYLEDNLRSTYRYADSQTIKDDIDDNSKIRWVAEEILNFSVNSIKGTLGTELLLTPFMLYKFVYFSKKKIYVNFNKYGIWEEFSRSSKDKSDLRLRLQTIVDVMFSINLSDLDYHGISSKSIISNLLDRILNCLDFYKDEETLEAFVQNSSLRYINFNDFIFNLETGVPYSKLSILQDFNVINVISLSGRYDLANEEFDINFSNLCQGLNFNKCIDVYSSEFDISNMDEYLKEHFSIDSKNLNKRFVNRCKSLYEVYYRKYCEKQQTDFSIIESVCQKQDIYQNENESSISNESIIDSFEAFLESDSFNYFISDETTDSDFLSNPMSYDIILNYIKNKRFIVTNQEVLGAYLTYCKNNNLEIANFLIYKEDGNLRANSDKSRAFQTKLKRFFKDKGYFYNKKSANEDPSALEDNIMKKIPIILEGSFYMKDTTTQKGYVGFSLKIDPMPVEEMDEYLYKNNDNKI
ncbi:hypothetical protein [Intestinibacter sp.]|uniref:hypothetical protein n=1 Tax=Intestinibacter sp. TaxID=1965304 RepID=UPI003F17C35B